MWFEGGRVDALVRCGGALLRTSRGASTQVGIAQVRRQVANETLSVTHVLFAPIEPRPLLLAMVELQNRGDAPLRVDYTELWDVAGSETSAATGACVCQTEAGPRALAEASVGIRAKAPEPLPTRGLALDLRIGLAPRAIRPLAFAYAAPGPNEDPALLVQAWRGDVRSALERTVARWLEQLQGRGPDLIELYRQAVQRNPEA